MSRRFRIARRQVLPVPREEVFAWFSNPLNLEALTPGFLHFRVLTPGPIAMGAGLQLDYQLRLYGMWLRWRSLIEIWEPPVRFVDVQLRGPYRYWRHEHRFAEQPLGTEMRDEVEYEMGAGWLGILAQRLFVARSLASIFDFRRQAITDLLRGPEV